MRAPLSATHGLTDGEYLRLARPPAQLSFHTIIRFFLLFAPEAHTSHAYIACEIRRRSLMTAPDVCEACRDLAPALILISMLIPGCITSPLESLFHLQCQSADHRPPADEAYLPHAEPDADFDARRVMPGLRLSRATSMTPELMASRRC